MRRKCRNHSASSKAKVAVVAAVRGEKTLAELAQQYDVHPNRIQDWRSRLVGNAERLFERGAGRDNDTEHQVKERWNGIVCPASSVVEPHAAQFTSAAFTDVLKGAGVTIRMDGKRPRTSR